MKCLQASAAIRRVLDLIGIRSTLWCGAVCFAEVFDSGSDFAWGGFWDRDHHVWLVTEFGEYVDLSISQMHKHPGSRRSDGIPVPAVWWDDISRWPSVITYLPDSPIGIGLEGGDAVDLARFLDLVQQAFHDLVTRSEVHSVKFGPLLTGPDGLNELHAKGLPWAVRAYEFEVRNVHRPSWIVDRQAELEAATSTRSSPRSRLDDILR